MSTKRIRADSAAKQASAADGLTVNIHALSKALGLSPKWVFRLVANKTLPPPVGRGEYSLIATIRAYCDHLRNSSRPTNPNQAEDKALLLRARRELAELELATKRGELVAVSVVQKVWTDCCSVLRTRLLAIPSKLSSILHSCRSTAEVAAELERELIATLTELSQAEIEGEPADKTVDDQGHEAEPVDEPSEAVPA